MQYKIPYGKSHVSLDIAEPEWVLSPKVPKAKSLKQLKKKLLNHYTRKVLKKSKNPIILVNDQTRSEDRLTPLKLLEPCLKNYSIMVATGTHKAPGKKDLEKLLGEYNNDVIVHDCHGEMRFLGTTSRGTRVEVNKEIFEHDLIIAIGKIEPHYFAGYSGPAGPCKSILPGVSGFETIVENHKLVMTGEFGCGSFEKNPVAQDMSEAAMMIEKKLPLLSIATVCHNNKLLDLFSGKRMGVFPKTRKCVDAFASNAAKPVDVLIVSQGGLPYDINFYQSQKCMEQSKAGVKKGGKMVVLAECEQGLGGLEKIRDVLELQREDALKRLEEHYNLPFHKAWRLLKLLDKIEISLYSEIAELPKCLREIKLIKSIDEIVEITKNKKVGLIPYGTQIYIK